MKKTLFFCLAAAFISSIAAPLGVRAQSAGQIEDQKQRNAIAIYTLCYMTNPEEQVKVIRTTTAGMLNQQNPGKQAAVEGFMAGPFDKEMRTEGTDLVTVFKQESSMLVTVLTQDEIDKLVNACLVPAVRLKALAPEFHAKVIMIGAPYVGQFTQAVLKKLQPQLQASSLAIKLN